MQNYLIYTLKLFLNVFVFRFSCVVVVVVFCSFLNKSILFQRRVSLSAEGDKISTFLFCLFVSPFFENIIKTKELIVFCCIILNVFFFREISVHFFFLSLTSKRRSSFYKLRQQRLGSRVAT